jgi:hypothetical protein
MGGVGMKRFENGDLVTLSEYGIMMVGIPNITDKIGIVLCDNLDYDNLVLVKWFATGGTSETHVDFIEKVQKNT